MAGEGEEAASIATMLLRILLERSSDKFPGVRSKALSNVAQVLDSISSDHPLRADVENIFFPKSPSESPSKYDMASIAKRRTNDEKCTVR